MFFGSITRQTSKLCLRFIKHVRCFSTRNDGIKSSYYHCQGTYTFVQSTLGDLVDEAADSNGDDIGFTFPFQNITRTYYQFKEETDQLAAGLLSLGLSAGDKIAIFGPNSYQWLLTQYAALKAGLVVVSINPASTEQELAYTLEKVNCQAIVLAESFKKRDFYKILCAIVPEISKSHPGQINSERFKELKNVIIFSDKDFSGAYKLQTVIQADGSDAKRLLNDTRRKVQADNPALVMFTSGTTGNPKAAVMSHFQIVNSGKGFINRIQWDKEKPVICLQLPLFHAFASICGLPVSLLSRGRCVFPSEHFDLAASIEAIEQEKCTMVYGVPTMFLEIMQYLRERQCNLQHWKEVLIGATPVPIELMKTLQDDFGLTIINAFGSTENCGVVTCQSPLDSHKTLGSSGKPTEHVEVKIVDENGGIVPVNTNGEILTRHPFIFTGYWNDAEKTREAVDETRWHHTGDIGRMDEEGNVYITGRIKDMVIRGGENIYPLEIENFLLKHPAIADVYVVGVPDQKFGEELCASIKLNPGCTVTEDEIKSFCKNKISYFKIPRYVLFFEEFQKTGSGKIMKYKLREECKRRLNM